MTAHRRIKIPFSAAPLGECRYCGNPILKADGTPNRRRNWHDTCLHEYKMANFPGYARDHVFARDEGRCRECGVQAMKWRRTVQHHAYRPFWGRSSWPFGDQETVIYCPLESVPDWHLDHIVPLIDGGTHTLDNMQTLCPAHHKAKTAREATERAKRRRGGE